MPHKTKPPPQRSWPLWVILALALTAAVWLGWVTPWGLGVSPDSVTYLATARHLLRGDGFVEQLIEGQPVPMTRFPPLYPLVLAAPPLLGVDLFTGAKVLGTALYALNVALVGTMIWRLGGGGWQGIIGATLAAVATPLAHIHLWVWSEPLFLSLVLGVLWVLSEHLERPRWKWLLAASVLTAAALLCRFAGFALLLSALLGLGLLDRRSWRFRIIGATAFAVIALAPTALWMLRGRLLGGTAAGRELAFHPPTADQWRVAGETVSSWVLPALIPGRSEPVPLGLRLAALVAAVGAVVLLMVWSRRRTSPAGARTGVRLVGLFVLVYPLFLLLSITFVDAHTPMDDRILSPWYAAVIVWLLSMAQARWNAGPAPGWALGTAAALLVCVTTSAAVMTGWQWRQARAGGYGYSSGYWRTHPALRFMDMLGPRVPVFTNGADVLRFYFPEHTVRPLPMHFDPASQKVYPDYSQSMQQMIQTLSQGQGVIILFDAIRRPYLPGEAELLAAAPMKVTRTPGATFYQLSEPAQRQ